MTKVPVIIPYFRAPALLERCTNAIKKQVNVSPEIYVRDNSVDNILFTKAVNEGIKKFAYEPNYEFILILNQDAFLSPQCLEHLIRVLRENPKTGIVTPLSLDKSGDIAMFSSLDAYPWGVSGGGRLSSIPKTAYSTYWANGACMLLRIEMIREIGLLDENMRFICSDADYSFTARARGWGVMIGPDALVEHELSSSAGSGAPNLEIEKVKLEDQMYFAKKWLSGDLYKSLAFEGRRLTKELVQNEMSKTEHQLALLNERLGSKPSSLTS